MIFGELYMKKLFKKIKTIKWVDVFQKKVKNQYLKED